MQRRKNADAWIQGAKHIRSKEVTHTQRSCIQGREFTQKHKLKYPHEKQRRARTQPTRSLHGGTGNKRAMILDPGLWWPLPRMRDLRSSGRNTWPQICGSRLFNNSGPVTQDYSQAFRAYRLKSRVGFRRCPRSDLGLVSAPVAKASTSSLPLLWGHDKGDKCPPPSYQKAPLAAQFGDPHTSLPPVNVPCVALNPIGTSQREHSLILGSIPHTCGTSECRKMSSSLTGTSIRGRKSSGRPS